MGDSTNADAVRQDLEQFWDTKLQHARERYFRAAADFHRHLNHNGCSANGSCAIEDARRAEAEAFADYCRVLATFTELVAIGKRPGPERPNVVVMPGAPE